MTNQSSREVRENHAFGLMGRLHLLLRRETGRVTDIKYMSMNPEYCSHVLELASSTAKPDLLLLAKELQEMYFGQGGLFTEVRRKQSLTSNVPLSRMAMPLQAPVAPPTGSAEKVANSESDQHYVGRLR